MKTRQQTLEEVMNRPQPDEFGQVKAPTICETCGKEFNESPWDDLCRECAEIEVYEEGYLDGQRS